MKSCSTGIAATEGDFGTSLTNTMRSLSVQERLRNTSGANRLGFALLLKFFEAEGPVPGERRGDPGAGGGALTQPLVVTQSDRTTEDEPGPAVTCKASREGDLAHDRRLNHGQRHGLIQFECFSNLIVWWLCH